MPSKKNKLIVEYISTAQPELEKLSSQRQSFLDSLNTKLVTLIKSGSLQKQEAENIMKSAKENPANVFNFLEVPSYRYSFGNIAKQSSQAEMDPIEMFARGLI